MQKTFLKIMAATALTALSLGTPALAAVVGSPAPDFTAKDSNGKVHKLADLKGKVVVLEWHNQGCPFVRSQYKGKMEKLQAKWTKKGVQWFTVISSAPGEQGYVDGAQANQDMKEHHAHPTAVLLDPKGTLGRAYGAKTTPHMFVIDAKGILVYDGAIDNAPLEDAVSPKNGDGAPYVNYVDQALTEVLVQGKDKVSIPSTPPYGCHVKYQD
jgi:peroxiredoxin